MSKILNSVLYALSFLFQFVLPIVFFGGVIPYTQEGKGAGLTKMGVLALFVLFVVLFFKVKKKIKQKVTPLTGSILDSIAPVVIWVAVQICLDHIVSTVNSLALYWGRVLAFIIIGRLLHWLASYLSTPETEANK